ncbi:MAG: hypothetical protein JHD16_04020 [Solirubrobacteraceae bacterium]|nr:hypothetical protein [Solirubrobacteraceae bacterium]
MASIIGFDAATLGSAGAVNRGRRATDPGNQSFAEVYDLAAYASSGNRNASRVATPRPAEPAPVEASPTALNPADRAAADRLYLHLTTGGSWLRVTDDHSGTVVMRLHDDSGAPVRELSITELQGGGPEVA